MRILIIFAVVLGPLLLVWLGWVGYVIYSTERPPYETREDSGKFLSYEGVELSW